jgi:hypothetical protein
MEKAYHDAAFINTSAVTSQHDFDSLQRFRPRYNEGYLDLFVGNYLSFDPDGKVTGDFAAVSVVALVLVCDFPAPCFGCGP